MADTLYKGTKEWLEYDITDRLGTLTDLTGTTPRFDVYNPAGTLIVTQAALTVVGMKAYALIDTTNSNFVASETDLYHTFLQFNTGPETPYLFGGDFFVKPVPV